MCMTQIVGIQTPRSDPRGLNPASVRHINCDCLAMRLLDNALLATSSFVAQRPQTDLRDLHPEGMSALAAGL